jgi:glycosyltransferase involved in cell wall biosynthesis
MLPGKKMITAGSPMVTIGIPTYNRASDYLSHALSSALNQTYHNLDIVVSDNCSTDFTETLVIAHKDSRIRYFRQSTKLTPNDNFNFCLQQAKGSYFLLLHDDDLIDHDFVEVCMRALGSHSQTGVIRTGTRVIDGAGRILRQSLNRAGGVPTTDFFLAWFANRTAIFFCSTLYQTEALRRVGGFGSKTNCFQDAAAAIQLAAQYGRLDVPDIKASFRRHSQNRPSRSKIEGWCDDSLYLISLMCYLVPQDDVILRDRGMVFFSKQNYNRVHKYLPFAQRLSAYLFVYRKFDYRYSPWRHICLRNFQRVSRQLKKLRSSCMHINV